MRLCKVFFLIKFLCVISIGILFSSVAFAQASEDVGIWDKDSKSFTDTFTNGDPLGVYGSYESFPSVPVSDSAGNVYSAFVQYNGSRSALYLLRYDGTAVGIWDADTNSFTDTFSNADPIDTGIGGVQQRYVHLAVDANDNVYVVFSQYDSSNSNYGMYLGLFDGSSPKIWDNDTSSFSSTLSDGDRIDHGTSYSYPQDAAVDASGRLYIAYQGTVSGNNGMLLVRYDGSDVGIWDNDTSSFTTTFSAGDLVDIGVNGSVEAQILIDSVDTVYLVHRKYNGTKYGVYLTRYDGIDVGIWDTGSSSFTDTFSNGDGVDAGGAGGVNREFSAALDSNNKMLIVFSEHDGIVNDVYLARFDGTSLAVWDQATSAFSSTFTDADPIDQGVGHAYVFRSAVFDSTDNLYVPIRQFDGSNYRIYLLRFDGKPAIWDVGGNAFSYTLGNGDPIDRGTGSLHSDYLGRPTVIDSEGKLYIQFAQRYNSYNRLFLVRFDGSTVGIWDNDSNSFSSTFSNGDPIDNGSDANVGETLFYGDVSAAVITPAGKLFIAFTQASSGTYSQQLYLTRGDFSAGPEIAIEGNSIVIQNGDSTPSSSDGSDFGSAGASSGFVDASFTIKNSNDTTLSLTGTPLVSISGVDAGDFSVITDPASSVAGNGFTSFTIRFAPTAVGTRSASISIANDDADENPYHFAVQGTGLLDSDGDGTPDVTDDDDDGDGLSDEQEAILGTDPLDADSDGDGIEDGTEVSDGSDPLDLDSFVEKFGDTVCIEWNGYLHHLVQILEQRNTSATTITLKTSLYDYSGTQKAALEMTLAPTEQFDLVLNILDGFERDTYGTVCSTVLDSSLDAFDGQLAAYEMQGGSYTLAYAEPFIHARSGSQYLGYNTYSPTGIASDFAANWIQISNDGASQEGGMLLYYDEDGLVVRSEALSINAKSRIDMDAHTLGGSKSGLIAWVPDNPNAEFRLRQKRYYFDGAYGTSKLVGITSIAGTRGSGSTQGAPFDTTGKLAVLEISNTKTVGVNVTASLFSSAGAAATSSPGTFVLPAKATVHFVLNNHLASALGNAVVSSDTAGSLVVNVLHYGMSDDGALQFADAFAARDGAGSAYHSSYNSYLGQGCKARIGNLQTSAQNASLTMTRYDGTVVLNLSELSVPAQGAVEIDLCGNETKEAYGEVLLSPANSGALVADVVRSNAEGTVEFSVGFRN